MEKNRLILSEIIRIIFSYFILYFTNFSVFIKIVLIISLEYLDCSPKFGGYGPLFSLDKKICYTNYYQKIDKVADIVCYLFILIYFYQFKILNNYWIYLILLLFFIRLIGSYLFIITNSQKYLFYFPNFFLEITLTLSFIINLPFLYRYRFLIFIFIFIFKIIQEYYLHIYKPKNKIFNSYI